MITITVRKDRTGAYEGFTCIGHAGYARRGKDIVCASVSVLVITTINSLEQFAEEQMNVVQNEKEGLIDCRFPVGLHEKGDLLMDAMLLGLQGIESSYGKKFLDVRFEEV